MYTVTDFQVYLHPEVTLQPKALDRLYNLSILNIVQEKGITVNTLHLREITTIVNNVCAETTETERHHL